MAAIFLSLLAALGLAEAFDRANALFLDMEYEPALLEVERLLSRSDLEPGDLAEAFRLQGLCLSALGRSDAAFMTFRKLLAIDPKHQLDPSISPKLAAPFFQALALGPGRDALRLAHSPLRSDALHCLCLKAEIAADPLHLIRAVRLRWWSGPGEAPETINLTTGDPLVYKLPDRIDLTSVSYYFEALGETGSVVCRLGSSAAPFRLADVDRPGEARAVSPEQPWPESEFILQPVEATATLPFATPAPGPLEGAPESLAPGSQGTWYTSIWFWAGIGGGIVAGGLSAVLLAWRGDPDPVDYRVRYSVVGR